MSAIEMLTHPTGGTPCVNQCRAHRGRNGDKGSDVGIREARYDAYFAGHFAGHLCSQCAKAWMKYWDANR